MGQKASKISNRKDVDSKPAKQDSAKPGNKGQTQPTQQDKNLQQTDLAKSPSTGPVPHIDSCPERTKREETFEEQWDLHPSFEVKVEDRLKASRYALERLPNRAEAMKAQREADCPGCKAENLALVEALNVEHEKHRRTGEPSRMKRGY